MDEPESKPARGVRLAELSIRHPVSIFMVFVSMIVLGGISITKIPLVLTPDINFPFIGVAVPYQNATPTQIQESITKPIEEALSTVPGIQRLFSRSEANEAWIGMRFDWGHEVDWLRSEVREKIEQVRPDLPADVEQIFVRTWSTDDFPILEGQLASHKDLRTAYDFLDLKIKKPLERVAGVAEVNIWGTQRKEIDVYLRLDDIRRHRVDVGSLFRRIDGANTNVSLGRVSDGGLRFGAITRGSVDSLEKLRDFPVNGRGQRLADIADIVYDQPPANSGRRLNGAQAIGFEIRKTSQANTVDTVERVLAKIEELNRDPSLQGIELLVWHDAGKEIKKSLSGLMEAGTVGALLAVVVLYLYLRRIGATLAIGFAIPFSIIATIGFLYLLGKTLNVLSMMGLMLATGMLVDNAVVVLESIFQNLEKGRDRVAAAIVGTRQVVTAVVAATLTSIIIFVPLVFGRKTNLSIWLSDTGTSIMVALACSLFISLTLIPLGVARLLKVDIAHKPRWERWLRDRMARLKRTAAADRPPSRIVDRYLVLVSWCTSHRFLVGFVMVPAMLVGSFLFLKKVPDNSPEAQDLQNLNIQYEFSENYHYAKIEKQYVAPVEQYLTKNKARFKIKDVSSFYGNNEAGTQVYFDKERITLEELKSIREQIAKGLPVIPGADIKLGRQEGAESQNWIGVNLYGEDAAVLSDLARDARRRLQQRPGFTEIHTDLDRGRQEVQIRLNRELARKYNISPQSVSAVLGIVVRGQRVRGYRTSEGEIEIWVRLLPDDREDLDDLKSIVVGSGPDGQDIQLSQVASLDLVKTPGVLQREDRRTYTWVFVNYSGDKKDEGKAQVTEVMNTLNYPQGYGWSYGFWMQRQEQEDRDFLFNILLALFMVYFVMASLFESLSHPFAIMLSLPFAFVGVVWMLYLTGTPFNLMARIGLLVLIGVVVNNGIVLLDHVNNLRRDGMPRSRAVLEGCRERFRPILMTASTTVVGLLPLALGTSGIFELRYFPLARTVMGGLISSTVLTLVVLPTYYTLFDDFSIWLKRLWQASGPKAVEADEAPATVLGD